MFFVNWSLIGIVRWTVPLKFSDTSVGHIPMSSINNYSFLLNELILSGHSVESVLVLTKHFFSRKSRKYNKILLCIHFNNDKNLAIFTDKMRYNAKLKLPTFKHIYFITNNIYFVNVNFNTECYFLNLVNLTC